MNMRAYHFIKYDGTTSLGDLIAQTDNNTVLCFDFEDSIQDCLFPINTAALKAEYRKYFKIIIDQRRPDIDNLKIGIRLNPTDTPEYLSDLIVIAGIKNISTIFLPKINSSEQILNLQNDLKKNNVGYNEIIPVIETKTGLNNLEEILRNNSSKISRIAFGHCDYNLDSQNYPYFHQDSKEYWTWITNIAESIKSHNISLVNSPLLSLDSDESYINMLRILHSICGNKCGQITLTKKQTNLCNSFTEGKATSPLPKIGNRLDLSVPEFYADDFIASFEKNYLNKGFAINHARILMSPQEYLSSLNYRNKVHFPDANFTFVGGCFPVQVNLPFENRFHQLLKHKIEDIREIKFNVNIIQYERFKNCIPKIVSSKENKPIDILVFSIRPEPFLRLVKLYYKFFDHSSGRRKWSLNLPKFNKVNPEKHDLLALDTRFNRTTTNGRSIIHKALINLNYILGSMIGNDTYSLRKYLDLVNEVIELSKSNTIKLVIIGTPIRTNTIMERRLSKKLDRFMKKSLDLTQDTFISGSDLMKNEDNLFEKNGIYATEKYHALMAERLLEKITPIIDKIAAPKRQTENELRP